MLVPAGAAQNPSDDHVYLEGDTPEVIDPKPTALSRTFQLVYQYTGAVATDSQTTVHLSVKEKPDWLRVNLPETVDVDVDPAGRESTVNVTVDFGVKNGYFPPAFKTEPIVIKLRAEPNGGNDGTTNTRGWILSAGHEPLFDIQVEETPVPIQVGESRAVDISVENLGNAAVKPSFRYHKVPDEIRVRKATHEGVIGTPSLDEHRTKQTVTAILSNHGGDWNRLDVYLRFSFSPVWGDSGEVVTRDVRIGVTNKGDPVGAATTWGGILMAIGGAAWYLRRRDDVPLPEYWTD